MYAKQSKNKSKEEKEIFQYFTNLSAEICYQPLNIHNQECQRSQDFWNISRTPETVLEHSERIPIILQNVGLKTQTWQRMWAGCFILEFLIFLYFSLTFCVVNPWINLYWYPATPQAKYLPRKRSIEKVEQHVAGRLQVIPSALGLSHVRINRHVPVLVNSKGKMHRQFYLSFSDLAVPVITLASENW